MFAKFVVLAVASCAAVLASPVPETTNPLQGLSPNQLQALQQQIAATLGQGVQQGLGQLQNVPQGFGQLANLPQAGLGQLANLQQGLGQLGNLPQGLAGLGQFANLPQQTFQSVQHAVGELTDRLSNGYVNTYDQQRDSVHNTLNNVKDMGTKGVESGMNIVKNALELLFLLPKFGRNVLANGAQQQQQQQQQIWPQGQLQQRVY